MGRRRRRGPAGRLRRSFQALCLALFLGLFLYVGWPYATSFSSDIISRKEWLPLETFLWLDPLVGLATAIAGRCWNVAVIGLGIIFALSLIFPRGFCGYLCPLGTLIDLFDWLIFRRIRWLKVPGAGWWVHLRYYILAAVLAGSMAGVLLAGYVCCIPILTRGLMFTAGRWQLGLLKNWGMVAGWDGAMTLSVALFAAVFFLSLFSRRFWCRYVCPTGALFSVMGLLRLTRRRVKDTCTGCGRCLKVCPFDAINEDFSSRELECATCRSCLDACPKAAISFALGGAGVPPVTNDQQAGRPHHTRSLSRRGLLASSLGGAIAAVATRPALGAGAATTPLLRPPGAVPERQFLQLCIRCGECFKVCPGSVLQPAGFSAGVDALWTPVVVPSHAGCHQECNFCTQVCPTGAIRPLTIEEKRKTQIGLAVLDTSLCLPHKGDRDCRLCYDECEAAGYHAIQIRPIELKVGSIPEGAFSPEQIEEMSRINAPYVLADACVGCGLCEYRCHGLSARSRDVLPQSAIVIVPPATPSSLPARP